jgi:hypothetical protein
MYGVTRQKRLVVRAAKKHNEIVLEYSHSASSKYGRGFGFVINYKQLCAVWHKHNKSTHSHSSHSTNSSSMMRGLYTLVQPRHACKQHNKWREGCSLHNKWEGVSTAQQVGGVSTD